MKIPVELLYTKDHEWVRVDGDKAYVGITDFAQDSLGDIVYVELPEEGDVLKAGDAFGVIESVKAASDVYLPVSGTIVEVNTELEDNSGLINEDAYGNWIICIELEDQESLKELLDADAYKKVIEE